MGVACGNELPEAKPFAIGKARRLESPRPTEEEWYRLLDYTETPDALDWEKTPGNLNLKMPLSVPVDRYHSGKAFTIFLETYGSTRKRPSAVSRIRGDPLYDDFSTPTFDTKHNLIKGGSWISTGNEILRASRWV